MDALSGSFDVLVLVFVDPLACLDFCNLACRLEAEVVDLGRREVP
jgi:hypothetical protein